MDKVRFAPSPTGYLHVGNARTALMNYLFVRRRNGRFVLRIEDTDVERSNPVYETSILEDLQWLGISWDEGPFRQSDRLDIYRHYSDRLLEAGAAYRCFCSKARLEEMRKEALRKGEPPRYDGTCRTLTSKETERLAREGKQYVVRFRSFREAITFHDEIHGSIEFPADHVDDFIILKQELIPSYNFAATVDDMVMNITHVIRGADHISNTPKQIMLFRAFGCNPPVYAHHSLLTGYDRKPLSKRHGATQIKEFRDMGVLRQALINYLAVNGRNVDRELMDVEELAETFSLHSLSPSDSLFDVEKLLWFNKEHIMSMPAEDLCAELGLPQEEAKKVLLLRENAKTLTELRELFTIFDGTEVAEEGVAHLSAIEGLPHLISTVESLLSVYNQDGFDEFFGMLSRETDLKRRDLLMALRILFTGRKSGPSLHQLYQMIPKDHIMMRIVCLKKKFSLT